ncbi:LysM peptidoglycan-binding domain-containing protein [Parachlamydia sp. AcF125]|uniref:LysM peptidoglycan-binding domain-containing protein n=1 Tax=Parachlamydia sp. AcF125 TaxID=2795736 RepID=UPI001BC8F06A|nr:LysM peptidoglycan-binding domain-containing protein [Parachlamydia sp. AcF125]MBS4167851.1 Peptidoglycan endopeptidase LytF [Parachlamydia sp. AcF125]
MPRRSKGLRREVIPFFLLLICMFQLEAAPSQRSANHRLLFEQELKSSLDILQHEFNNHEKEIVILEQKCENLQETIHALSNQISDHQNKQKEFIRTNASSQEGRLCELESLTKKMMQDLKSLQTHLNESNHAISKLDQKLTQLAHSSELQRKNMENMQTALAALMDFLQPQQQVAQELKLYEVKEGDSLGKIAQLHKTSVKVLKELNGLTQDRIRKGQKLKLP